VDVFRLHHPDEPEQHFVWSCQVRNAVKRGLGWGEITSGPPSRWPTSPPAPGLTLTPGWRVNLRITLL
jgi:hypothetical protein